MYQLLKTKRLIFFFFFVIFLFFFFFFFFQLFSFLLILLFTIVAVFIDPSVMNDGQPVDIFSITTVFLTLNTLPMMAIAYINDPALAKSVKALTAMLSSKKKIKKIQKKFGK